jgi:hypothetical protein
MPRNNQSREIFKDDIIGNWTVVSEQPKRVNGKLLWTISCPSNHEVQAEHSSLSFGVAPSICTECARQAASQRAQERIEEKRLAKEIAKELALAALEQLHSAPVAQQEEVNA